MQEPDLERARRGDPAAFERLVNPYLKELFFYIRKRVGQQAEDAYQETLLAAWRAIPGFKEGSTLKTWLYAIAGYKCADALRQKGREPQWAGLEEHSRQAGFEEEQVKAMTIRDALAQFDGEDQALLYLVYTQGFTQVEAAMLMGIPEGTVKSRLYRLRNQLKARLGGEGHGL